MNKRLAGAALAAGFVYALLCWALVAESPTLIHFLQRVPASKWSAYFLMSAIGPAVFLPPDGEWSFFVTAMVMVAACSAAAFYAWKRWPQSEVFVALILMAMGIWACCGWLFLLVHST